MLQLASFGPLARSIDDLRLSFRLIADPATPHLEPPPKRPLRALRIAWTDDFGGVPLTDGSRRVMEQLGHDLARHGCSVERNASVGFDYDEAWYVGGACLAAVNSLFHSPVRRQVRRIIGPVLSACGPRDALMQGLAAGASLRGGRVRDALVRRERLIDELEGFFDSWDAWICPVFSGPAFTHRSHRAPIEVDGRRLSSIRANLLHGIVFNMTGHPAVTIPVGQSPEGLPIGVQVIGRRWRETALLDVADEISRVAGGYRRPPGY